MMLATLRRIIPNLHYACTVLLAILVVPAIHYLRLTSHLEWRNIFVFYWWTLGSRSLLYAMVFCVLASPFDQSFGPFWARYRREKLRIVFALVFVVLLCVLLPFTTAVLSAVQALFVIELVERSKSEGGSFARKAISIFTPAAYMFGGLTLVIIYNDIVVANRFPLSYDAFLNRVDARILWGQHISSLAHTLCAMLPARALTFLDFSYFQMFAVVGGGLLMSSYYSYKRGLQFAGACLTAYYLALLIFYVWPTYGPYVFCPTHAAQFPSYLTAYVFQASGMASLQAVSQHKSQHLASGYYIAFPALHVGLPVIAMWCMRRWRRVFWLLAAYNCIVICAIVTLEWHYVIDLVGGVVVGALALAIVGWGAGPAIVECA
ncbi:MAG TPA: phosphatase PAP2 family protein [Candidatus Dormibacteraeota bacterium]|nr:phosphatase PAP2 family protein [Candidatus Dormibacteraeota bacterium]